MDERAVHEVERLRGECAFEPFADHKVGVGKVEFTENFFRTIAKGRDVDATFQGSDFEVKFGVIPVAEKVF